MPPPAVAVSLPQPHGQEPHHNQMIMVRWSTTPSIGARHIAALLQLDAPYSVWARAAQTALKGHCRAARQSEDAEARFGIEEAPERRSRPDHYTGVPGPAGHVAMLE